MIYKFWYEEILQNIFFLKKSSKIMDKNSWFCSKFRTNINLSLIELYFLFY